MNTVLIADRRPAFLHSFQAHLCSSLQSRPVYLCTSLRQLWQGISDLDTALILVGVRHDDGNGFDVCHHVTHAHPTPKVLFWTDILIPALAFEAKRAGSIGVLPKTQPPDSAVRMIHHALEGQAVWTYEQRLAIEQWRQQVVQPLAPLTEMEGKVASHLALRYTNREIAQMLCVTERTIEGYVSRVLDKLEYRTRIAFAQWAEGVGWAEWIRFRRSLKAFTP